MATPGIGSLTFTFLWGRVDASGMAVEEITRPGVDGFGAAKIGRRAEATRLLTMLVCADAAAAEAHYAAAKLLEGADPVTVTYGDATTQENVQVLKVEWGPERIKEVASVVGATGTHEAWLAWTVRHRYTG